MKKYYIYYPRNFANEYDLYSVEGAEQEANINALLGSCARKPNADCHRITRKEAEHLAAQNREAYRTGEATYCNPAGATEIYPYILDSSRNA